VFLASLQKAATLEREVGRMQRTLRRRMVAAVLAAVSAAIASEGQSRSRTPITACGQVVRQDAFRARDLDYGLVGFAAGKLASRGCA
jgi:hypothetical protein